MSEAAHLFQVRDATVQDVPLIARYNIDMALETDNRHLDRSTVLAGVAAVLSAPELGRYFLATFEQEIIGQAMVTYEWSDWRSGLFWWLQSAYVRPGARRRGAFTAIYRHIHARAKSVPGVVGVRLRVNESNTKAKQTFARLGMTLVEHSVFEDVWSNN